MPFDPSAVKTRGISYVSYTGQRLGSNTVNVSSAEEVFNQGHHQGDFNIANLRFQDPDHFVAGQLHSHLTAWENILSSDDRNMCLKWIRDGVRLQDFIRPFEGTFWGKSYKHDFPVSRQFNNANKCKYHVDFINKTIYDSLQNGSIFCLGKHGSSSVKTNAYMTSIDVNSAFDNVKLHPDSYGLVGFQ